MPFAYYSQEEDWTITPLTLPSQDIQGQGYGFTASSVSGNLTVKTYGINARANCKMASITFEDKQNAVASVDGCSYKLQPPVDPTGNSTRWHFSDSANCTDTPQPDIAFKAFFYATFKTSGFNHSDPSFFVAVMCRPSISIASVMATVSVAGGRVGSLVSPPQVLETFRRGENTSDPHASTLLGPPLYGLAVNGYDIAETLNALNSSRTSRVNLTQNIIYEGIYGAQLGVLGTSASENTNVGCS